MLKTFVLYIGVKNVRSIDIGEYIKNISKIIFPINIPENSSVIIVPTDSVENRIECIDPLYITDQELINKHNVLLQELNNKLEDIKYEK